MAAGEGLREVARAAGSSEQRPRAGGSRALVPIRGFYIKTNPPLGRPILSPAPASPSRGGWFTPRLPPITHCSSPRVRGTRHEGCPGTAAPREPGAQRPRPRRLTFLMLAPGPSHMDFYNLTSPWPRAAGRSRSRRQSRSPSVQEREEEKEERGGEGGSQRRRKGAARRAEAGRRAGRGRRPRGRHPPQSRDARSRGRSQTCAPPRPQPRRSARSLARSLALRGPDSHSQHSRGAARGAGAGTRAPPRGAAESARAGRGAGAGGFQAPLPGRPQSLSFSSPSHVPDAPCRVPTSKSCQVLRGNRWLQRHGQG